METAHLNPGVPNGSGTTVIMTVWKRDHIVEQVTALLEQTEKPEAIWLVHYGNHVALDGKLEDWPFVQVIHSDVDLKYFGRFSLAQYVATPYVWIIDDDVIPAAGWLAQCRLTCEGNHAIVSCSGRLLDQRDFVDGAKANLRRHAFGDDGLHPSPINYCPQDTLVDFGCQSWFFKTEWLKGFWQVPPYTFSTGEDIHLSAACKIINGVNTIVPRQLDAHTSGNLKKRYGLDEHASWRAADFQERRAEIVRHLIANHKWQPVLWQ